MQVLFDPNSVADYRRFLAIKALPQFRVRGRLASFPDEYARLLGIANGDGAALLDYRPLSGLFDYQRDITRLAIRKRKFAVFADCGLGKTLILLEYARHVADSLPSGRCVLIVCPLMVAHQTVNEAKRFYGDTLPIDTVRAADLNRWLASGAGRVGITNYEAITDRVNAGRLGSLILDESSMLKSHYGKWGQRLIDLGAGLDWKLCLTGTPAPNDRIEYANHAVFLDQFPTVNAFLAKYFVNRGETGERWELKPHALRPFYRSLSHWCIFLSDPSVYGWKDNAGTLPPINVHYHEVPLTDQQEAAARKESPGLYIETSGGFVNRGVMARIAKGSYKGETVETNKINTIRDLVDSFGDESTLIWCRFNTEQDDVVKAIPGCGNIDGDTPYDNRIQLVEDFQAGRLKRLVSKPKILGFGQNLQICTRMVFSSLQDSYEEYYQAVKRANRYGSTLPLNVHIPLTEIERPMVENVMRKARMIQQDTLEQERLFKEVGYEF